MQCRRFLSAVAALCLGGLLAACATPAEPGKMMVAAPATPEIYPAPLVKAMCVRTVTGGEGTNPMWTSKVDNEAFKTALTGSMAAVNLVAPAGACPYPVDVNLLGLSQPIVGFDMEVISHANYKVYDVGGRAVLLATVTAPFTAKMSDAFVGVIRLKLANEGSIRTSISLFLEKLRGLKLP